MEGQLIAVGLLVCVAALYLGRRVWRTWSGQGGGCGKSCGCGKPAASKRVLIPSDELTVRVRNGQ